MKEKIWPSNLPMGCQHKPVNPAIKLNCMLTANRNSERCYWDFRTCSLFQRKLRDVMFRHCGTCGLFTVRLADAQLLFWWCRRVRLLCPKVAHGVAPRRYVNLLTLWHKVRRDLGAALKAVLKKWGTKMWPALIFLFFQYF